MALPATVIDEARAELARRLGMPPADAKGEARRRLEARRERLLKQFSRGDLNEPEYRTEMADVRQRLATLPDPDRVLVFDRHRKVIVSMLENIDHATPGQLADLLRMLVERVEADEGEVRAESIEWTPPAGPFMASRP